MTTNNTFNNQNREENNTFSKTNSQDLTELWKKGELENGEYFVLTNLGVEKIEYIKEHNGFGFDEIEWVEEVLAPVPSWEQWQQMKAFCEEFNALNVAEENQRLKSLLKEWIHYYPIVLYEYEDTLKTKDIIELYDRTREVLQ